MRLFKREAGQFSDDLVHERIIVAAGNETTAETASENNLRVNLRTHSIGRLKNDLLHYSYTSQQEVQEKIKRYAKAGAEQLQRRGAKPGVLSPYTHSFWAFLRTYVLKRGFLDGWAGCQIASMNASVAYQKYKQARI